MGFCDTMYTLNLTDLGWRGDARQFRVEGLTPRMAEAIRQRAASLGISEVTGLPGGPRLMVRTGPPQAHQAADRLIAYIDGLADVLSGEYGRGDEPVAVPRSAVLAAVQALDDRFDPRAREAAGPLRAALGLPVPPVPG